MEDLKGKTVIVTGASSGLGRGIAHVFAQKGCRLLLTCRNNISGLDDTAQLCSRYSPEVIPFKADISNIEDIDAIAARAQDVFGRIDVLVNNAGITNKYSYLDITEAEFDNIFSINCKGTFFCGQRIARLMVKQNRGKIINISSLTAKGATEDFSAYSSTKAAINKFSEVMALELAPYNIQVNSISAGWIQIGAENEMPPEMLKRCMYHIPFGRFGTAEDVGELAAFLGSDLSDYITGQTIYADGGQSSLLSMVSRTRDADFFEQMESLNK